MFGSDAFDGAEPPLPQQTPLQEEEDPETSTPAGWTPRHRRQLFLYATKPTDTSAWIRFRIGWLSRTGSRWSKQMELRPPMRVRCHKGQRADLQTLVDGRFVPLAINAGLDGSGSGTANLQQLLPAFAGWLCRQRHAAAVEALKRLVVER